MSYDSKSYYSTLGLKPGAKIEEIKQAYRELVKKWHPDYISDKSEKNVQKAREKMHKINEAYNALKNPVDKEKYDSEPFDSSDRYRNQYEGGSWFGQSSGFEWSSFNDEFGRTDIRNYQLSLKLNIMLSSNLVDTAVKINYKRQIICKNCNGVGYQRVSKIIKCNGCGGTGKRKVKIALLGNQTIVTTCEICQGAGTINYQICKICMKKGNIVKKQDLEIKLRAHLYEGEIIKIPNYGHEYALNKAGDLIIQVKHNHPNVHQMNHYDIYSFMHMKVKEIVEGKEYIFINYDNKELRFRIPLNHKSTDYLNLGKFGHGIGKNKGNLYIKLLIVF